MEFPVRCSPHATLETEGIRMTRLALAYAFGILTLLVLADFGALRPVVDALSGYRHLDKLVHFVMYGSLALVVNAALAGRAGWSLLRAIVTGSTIVLIASTVDEYSNLLVPERGWSLADLAANFLGVACLGVVPWLLYAVHLMLRLEDTRQHEC
jgi:VanZ family protein